MKLLIYVTEESGLLNVVEDLLGVVGGLAAPPAQDASARIAKPWERTHDSEAHFRLLAAQRGVDLAEAMAFGNHVMATGLTYCDAFREECEILYAKAKETVARLTVSEAREAALREEVEKAEALTMNWMKSCHDRGAVIEKAEALAVSLKLEVGRLEAELTRLRASQSAGVVPEVTRPRPHWVVLDGVLVYDARHADFINKTREEMAETIADRLKSAIRNWPTATPPAVEHHPECAWSPGNDECCSCAGRGPATPPVVTSPLTREEAERLAWTWIETDPPPNLDGLDAIRTGSRSLIPRGHSPRWNSISTNPITYGALSKSVLIVAARGAVTRNSPRETAIGRVSTAFTIQSHDCRPVRMGDTWSRYGADAFRMTHIVSQFPRGQ